MAPAVASRTSRASTPDPRKATVGDAAIKENANLNSPDRRAKIGPAEKKALSTNVAEKAASTNSWCQRAWRMTVMLAIVAIVVTAGVVATPQFDRESARNFFASTSLLGLKKWLSLLLGSAACFSQWAIQIAICNVLSKVLMGSIDAAWYLQRAVDMTGYLDGAGYFHPSLSRSALVALGVAPVSILVGVWMPLRLRQYIRTKRETAVQES